MMKRSILALLALCFTLSIASTSLAYTINNGSIDVGNVDNLLAQTTLGNSSIEQESAWGAGVLATQYGINGVTFATKIEDNLTWFQTDQSPTIYALKLTVDPAYYIIKTGKFKDNPSDHFLMENNASISWALIDLSIFGEPSKIDIFKISHITEDDSTPVPEPGTLALLGAGLFGFAVWHRRRQNR